MIRLGLSARLLAGLIACYTAFGPATASAGALATLAASMQPGTFAELTGMQGWNSGSVLVASEFGCTSQDYILQYADKAAWDPVNDRVAIVGQAHGSCYGGRMAIYTEATNTWSVGPYPSGICQSGTASNPCFAHAYSHNTADPSNGDLYYRHYSSMKLWRFRGGSWSSMAPVPAQSVQCCGAIEFFPDMSRMIWVDGDWGVWAYNPSSNGWAQIANTNGAGPSGLPKLPMSPYNDFAVYNKTAKVVLVGGGHALYKISANGSVTTMKTTPVDLGVTNSVIASDPNSGTALVLAGSGMWQYDIAADSWAQVSVTVPSVLSTMDGFGDGLVQVPIPEHGVIMYIKYNFGSSKVYLYKHSPFTAKIPNSPTALTAQ